MCKAGTLQACTGMSGAKQSVLQKRVRDDEGFLSYKRESIKGKSGRSCSLVLGKFSSARSGRAYLSLVNTSLFQHHLLLLLLGVF